MSHEIVHPEVQSGGLEKEGGCFFVWLSTAGPAWAAAQLRCARVLLWHGRPRCEALGGALHMPLPCTARKRKRQNRFRERMWFEPGPGTRTCKSASRADFPRGYGSPRCPLPPQEPSWGALGTRRGLLGLLQGTGGTCGGSARKPAKGPLGLGEDEGGARSEEEKPWGRGIRVEVLPQTLQKPAPAPQLQAALVLCGDAVE